MVEQKLDHRMWLGWYTYDCSTCAKLDNQLGVFMIFVCAKKNEPVTELRRTNNILSEVQAINNALREIHQLVRILGI